MFRKVYYCLILLFVFSFVTAQENRLEKLIQVAKEKKLTPKNILEIEDLVEKSHNELLKMDAYIVLGDTYRDLEVYDKAYQFYLKMVKLAEKNKLTYKIGLFKEALGSVQFRLGNFEKSLQFYMDSKKYYEKANDFDGVIRAKGNIALVYMNTGRTQKAIESITAIVNEKKISVNLKANALINLGAIYHEIANPTIAIKYYLKALSLLEKTESNRQKIMICQNLAESFISLKEYDKALAYNYKSEVLLQKTNSNELKSSLYFFYAEICKGKSDYKGAFKNIQLFHKFKEMSDDSRNQLITENIETLNKIENQKLDLQIKEQKIQLLENEKFATRIRVVLLILLIIGILLLSYYLIKKQRSKVKTLSHVIHQTEDKLEFTQTKTEKMVMNFVKNNDFIERFKENLKHVQKNTNDAESKIELGKLLIEFQNFKLINDTKEDLFNQVDAQFSYKLNKKYPSLTEEEQKICILIYLDLKNKDIAVILNLSLRSVENCRYRIRKKMDLDANENLSTVLQNL